MDRFRIGLIRCKIVMSALCFLALPLISSLLYRATPVETNNT